MEQNIISRLDRIEIVLRNIQERMDDSNLTNEERKMLDDSIDHEKEGKLFSIEEIKNARAKIR